MTEQPLVPPLDAAPEPVVVPSRRPSYPLLPWLYGLAFLVLAAAILYLWQFPGTPAELIGEASAVQALEQRLTEMDSRLLQLEKRPTPDLTKITARLDALDGRIPDQTQLSSRLDTLSGRIESLSARDQTGLDATKQRLDALTSRIAAVEATAGGIDTLAKRLNRIAKIQEASFALASGRPVGDLPGAPDAVARYAHAAPPTEAQLRLRFQRDEQTALAETQPEIRDAPFIGRVWDRAQGLITIRRGNDVVVGNPASIVLGHAQDALDVGDIAAAVTAVELLKGPSAEAMASWLADAKALLGARSALTDMANGS